MFPSSNPYPAEPVRDPRARYAQVVARNLGGPLPSADRLAMWFAAGLTGYGVAGRLTDAVQTAFERGAPVAQGEPLSRDQVWSRMETWLRSPGGRFADVLGLPGDIDVGGLQPQAVAGKLWTLLDNPARWLPAGTSWSATDAAASGPGMTRPVDPLTGQPVRSQPAAAQRGALGWILLGLGALFLGRIL